MSASDCFIKQRALWQPSAYRLLREPGCARYARQVVPPVMDGFQIVFPETAATIGRRIAACSRRLPGQPLHHLLYQPQTCDLALDVGMAVVAALHGANVTQHPFATFGLIYRVYKGLNILLHERLGAQPLLSPAQRQEMGRLARRYLLLPAARQVLVHGDLQPSHLIFDAATATVGIIDLEALHVGKPAANFGQLFTGYHYADPTLGRELYRRYRARFPVLFDGQFDDDLRAAVALRCYRHVQVAQRRGYAELERQARELLAAVLAGPSFAALCGQVEDW